MDFVALHEFASGLSRHFASTRHFGRFPSEADIEPDLRVHGLNKKPQSERVPAGTKSMAMDVGLIQAECSAEVNYR